MIAGGMVGRGGVMAAGQGRTLVCSAAAWTLLSSLRTVRAHSHCEFVRLPSPLAHLPTWDKCVATTHRGSRDLHGCCILPGRRWLLALERQGLRINIA
jgi:hypothetical protein